MLEDRQMGVPNHLAILRADDDEKDFTSGESERGRRKLGRMAGASSSHDRITMANIKARISYFWKKGDTYQEICDNVSDEFGLEGDQRLKPNNVHYHIKSQINYWKEVGLLNIDEKYAIALARWEQIEALATEAYFNSMRGKSTKNYEKQIERARSKDREKWIRDEIKAERELALQEKRKPKIHDLTHEIEGLQETSEKIKEYERFEDNLAGSAQWVKILVEIHDKRCKMWDLYKNHDTAGSPDQEMARLSDEDRDSRLSAVLNAAILRKTQEKAGLAAPAPLGGFQDGQTPAELSGPRAQGIKVKSTISIKDLQELENDDF